MVVSCAKKSAASQSNGTITTYSHDSYYADESDKLKRVRLVLPDIFRQTSLIRKTKQEKSVRFLLPNPWNHVGSLVGGIYKFSRPAAQKEKPDSVSVNLLQMKDFFSLLETDLIRRFLDFDLCKIYADSYLLAMVFTYFVRAGFGRHEYTIENFFGALMLAHDVEEDAEDLKFEFLGWALGDNWRSRSSYLYEVRDKLFRRLNYRALVSRKCCLQVMNLWPKHPVWKRERPEHHGGCQHCSDDSSEKYYVLVHGPNCPPTPCVQCEARSVNDKVKEEAAATGKRRLSLSKFQDNFKCQTKKLCSENLKVTEE